MAGRRIRVVLDGHAITPHRSGIGVYAERLCDALLEYCCDSVELHLYAASRVTRIGSTAEMREAVSEVEDGSLYAMSHQLEIPKLLARGRYDVFHSPDFLAPLLLRSAPIVTTIHDVVPLACPELLARSKKTRVPGLFLNALRLSVRRSARVMTDSDFSRSEIARFLRLDPEKISVVPLAASLQPMPGAFPARFAGRFTPGEYFLFVGRMDPYKGLSLLTDAYARAYAARGDPFPDLVITGSADPRYDISLRLQAPELQGKAHMTGYVSEAELSALYSHARALVLPSLYEGFGFPVLDAMAHGTPVLCSNRASLPEVAGVAALMMDPEDGDSFSKALSELASDENLRARLSAMGLQRVKEFSWKNTALAAAEIYERAASTKREDATA